MKFKAPYERMKARVLSDPLICQANREVIRQFLEFEEYKLKRRNGLSALDGGCYSTLYGYLHRFRNVNRWFENKPWPELTREDMKRVYDGLEDGTIRNRYGQPFGDRPSYYNKIFKAKPFRIAGKAEIAREVIEFSTPPSRTVRYLTEESFRRLVSVLCKPRQLLLLWLAWDIGENINTLLALQKCDFIAQSNTTTGEKEYVVNLPKAKLKRSRRSRSELTLYPETAMYADMVLTDLGPQAKVFNFEYRQAVKVLHNTVRKTHASTMPNGDRVRWKDFRSGMACHLLRNGWTSDEVNARLGHTPHSSELDAYINFLALDRSGLKRRLLAAKAQATTFAVPAPLPKRLLSQSLPEVDENRSLRAELDRTQKELNRIKDYLHKVMQMRHPSS